MNKSTAAAAMAVVVSQQAMAGGTVVGFGATTDAQLPVPALLGPCNTLSAGSGHSAAIRQNGLVACWGLNASGQCNVPATVGPCTVVSAGGRHTAAIKATGGVVAWGDNTRGQRSVPAGLGACLQVSCGDSHTVALRTTGYVVAWGDNSYGQSSVPAASLLGTCTAVEAGAFHTIVIKSNGFAAAWGDASETQGLVPNDLGACISIGAGDLHSAAVRTNGTVRCWGNNNQGQTSVPASLQPCIAVACGDFHTIALQQDGTVTAWGYNSSGQAQVPANWEKCTQIAGGGAHTLSLSSNVAVPTGVTATDGSSTATVTISWTAAAGAAGYRVFRAVGAGLGWQIGTTTTTLTFVDSAAVAGTSYTYWVKTITANGDSVASAVDTGWRNVAVPTGVGATDGTLTTGVAVTWTAVPGAAGYRVYRSIGSGTATQVGTPSATQFTDTSAVAGTVYTYKVCARTAAGNSPFGAADTGWRNIAAPTAVAATDGSSSTGVTITWTAATGAAGYRVYRAIGTGAATELGAPAETTFSDATGTAGTVYNYSVRARTTAGNSAASAADTGWRNLPAPSGIGATDGTLATRVRVTWSPIAGATSYAVYRKLPAGASTRIATVTGGATALFDDTTIAPTVIGTYRVRAISPAGYSEYSESDTGFRASAFTGDPPGNESGGADGESASEARAQEATVDHSPRGAGRGAKGGNQAASGERGDDGAGNRAEQVIGGELDMQCDAVIARAEARAAWLRSLGKDHLAAGAEALAIEALLETCVVDGAPKPCPACRMADGDVNLDGSVDGQDVGAFLAALVDGDSASADLNRDGWVDLDDLARVLGR